MTGDASLSRRPMRRVLAPLMQMGLEVLEPGKETLPLTLRGYSDLIPIVYPLPVPSAQVKSAVLIAGLHAAGETTVIEHEATRDHTERMLRHFGADVRIVEKEGARYITVKGDAELSGQDILVPGDPSSAAFLVAAALIVPGSDVTIEGVLVNPTRTGLYTTLQEMGGDVALLNEREEGGEPVADIRVRASRAQGRSRAGGACAVDDRRISGARGNFGLCGRERRRWMAWPNSRSRRATACKRRRRDWRPTASSVRVDGDSLIVEGGGRMAGGGRVATHLDHRIAMAFLTAGLASEKPIIVDDTSMIATSFPEFRGIMEGLGARFEEAPEQ